MRAGRGLLDMLLSTPLPDAGRAGAGEKRQVEIVGGFEPERVVVDPDVLVLQLRRRGAGVGL